MSVVIQAPMSYIGSAKRIWKLAQPRDNQWIHGALIILTFTLIGLAWVAVTIWYLFAVWLMIPYRIIRRSQRKQRRDMLELQERLK